MKFRAAARAAIVIALGWPAWASAQTPTPVQNPVTAQGPGPLSAPNWSGQVSDPQPVHDPTKPSAPTPKPLSSLGSERLRLSVDFMGGYGYDGANSQLGFEQQGRVGYATLTLSGRLSSRISYGIAINPIDENDPLPACGDPGFFYPNDPKFLYGENTAIPCAPKNGNRRVDFYRGIALDPVNQQGPIREAYVDIGVTKSFRFRFGRSRLPLGFDWQEAGSITAKDATRIQRINARASFGMLMSYVRPRPEGGRPKWTATVGAHIGEDNRYFDYDYFYFEDSSLDANSAVTAIGAVSFAPIKALDVRAAYQFGYTGSKVERLPSYWASKRHDDALVVSVAVQPVNWMRVLFENASYRWGPTRTSAEMLGVDPNPIRKNGFYVTGEAWKRLRPSTTIGGSLSVERLDRADSLVKFMASQGLYGVTEGKRDGMTALRVFIDLQDSVRIAFYRNWDRNPFPWLSGIMPVTGGQAFQGREPTKWGIDAVLRVR